MTDKTSSYQQILRSSILIGGASAISLFLGLVRNKALALMLGPAGFGLIGLFTAIVDVSQSFAGMGVNQSGVRQIADSAAKGGIERAALTAHVLRRTSVVLGMLGAAALILFAGPIANLSFGSDARAHSVRLLGGVVLLALIAEGQSALLQGLRKIGDLAKARVLGALYGTVAVVGITYAIGEQGIVPAMVVAAALGALTAAWYVRQLKVATPNVDIRRAASEASGLLMLGFAFMISGFSMMGASYAVRAIVTTGGGLHAAGLYQAAWSLGGLYTGFILQAMGTDFYPRLVGAIGEREVRNRLVNEQATASLVLAGPGVIATLALAPFALSLLYSSEFHEASATLRWICLGMALRVVTWPPGFLIVSFNERLIFIGIEIAWALLNVGLTVILVERLGLEGAGIAFATSYVSHGILVYAVAYRRYGFRLDRGTLSMTASFLFAIAVSLIGFRLLEELEATVLAITILIGMSIFSLRALATMIPQERLPRIAIRILRLVRMVK